jgi:hypothetical protein
VAAKAYNPTPQPVVIDEAGHILAGGEHGEVDTSAPPVIAAVGTSRLVLLDAATQTRVEKAYAEARAGKAAEQDSADAAVDGATGAPIAPAIPESSTTSSATSSASGSTSTNNSSTNSSSTSPKGA